MKKSRALAPTTATGRPTRDAIKGLATLPAVATAMDTLESTVGGRAALITALAAAPLDDDLIYVLHAIADPRQDARKLSTVCRKMGISLFDVYQALKEGIYANATLAMARSIAAHQPTVVRELLESAVIHEEDCPACEGMGSVTNVTTPDAPPTPCLQCKGRGKVRVVPDLDTKKAALAINMGPLSRKDAPLVNVDARSLTVHDHSPAGFAQLLAATDRVLHGRREQPPAEGRATTHIVDGEVREGS